MLLNRLNGAALTPFHALSHELDRVLGGFLEAPTGAKTNYPPVSIWEDENAFHLEAEVPGIAGDDLDVQVLGNRLTLRGERRERARENTTVHREEWKAFKFERSFELPVDVDGDSVHADLDAGILRLTLPKAPTHKPVKVQVRASKAE